MSDTQPQHRCESVLSLIRRIQQGSINPTSVAPDDRRRCVEHLTAEGYSAVEIAEILQVTERTVYRDRAEFRQANALQRDPQLAPQMAGQLVGEAEQCIGRIRRITRDRQINPSARIEGERACWIITNQLVERLQSLGYLPTSPTEIRGEMTHHVDQLPAFTQMQGEVDRLELIISQDGQVDPDLIARLTDLKLFVSRGAAHEQITDLSAQLPGNQDDSPAHSRPPNGADPDLGAETSRS